MSDLEIQDPFGEEFLSKLPDTISNAAKRIPREWVGLTESELKKICYPIDDTRDRDNLFDRDERIRALFWIEVQRAHETNTKVSTSRVCADVMLPQNFINSFLKNDRRVAWMLCPFGSHVADVTVMVKSGNDRMKEILAMPLTRKICRCHWGCICPKKMKEFNSWACACKDECRCLPLLDHKLAELMIKIYEKIELRAKGSVPQVINQRSLNMNVNKNLPTRTEEKALADCSMEEINMRLAQLEAELEKPQLPPARDIAPFLDSRALNVDDGLADTIEAELNRPAVTDESESG